jgi:DNA repair photolyase
MELDGLAFEKKIFVKKDAAVLLTREIATKYSFAAGHEGAPEHICIGTATDPYQPAEKEYSVTRACLEELARHRGLSVSITTKSNLVTRDIEVLQEIAKHSRVYVDITITTLRPRLARLLEPRAPRPDLRLAAIKKLSEAGIAVGALASPGPSSKRSWRPMDRFRRPFPHALIRQTILAVPERKISPAHPPV